MKKKVLKERLEAERNTVIERIVEKHLEEITKPKKRGRKKND